MLPRTVPSTRCKRQERWVERLSVLRRTECRPRLRSRRMISSTMGSFMSNNRNTHIRSLHDVVLGAKLANIAGDDTCTEGGTTASEATPGDVAAIQQRLRILQWATPAHSGVIIVLGAQ
jgi:hypothetical protein